MREVGYKEEIVFAGKIALLLDMNGTFMFGEDRFSESEDFSIHYKKIGGALSRNELNDIILSVYRFLDERYPDEKYRHNFPSVENAIKSIIEKELSQDEIHKIIDVFSFHELGYIPEEHIEALFKLREKFTLAVVIDIWSPKKAWVETFERLGINKLFSASSFSSDHGMVKPSPKPFERIVCQLNVPKEKCLVIGDSPRRDLGGAKAAAIDCILVGGANDAHALGSFPSLLELCNAIQ